MSRMMIRSVEIYAYGMLLTHCRQRIQVNSTFDVRFSSPCWIICVKLSVEVNVFDPILAIVSTSIMPQAVRLCSIAQRSQGRTTSKYIQSAI